jgi:hypothetical protein
VEITWQETAFPRALPPPAAAAVSDEAVARGGTVFRACRCAECHAPPEYTARGGYDVGLADEAGNREFNPPSLRGVGMRGGGTVEVRRAAPGRAAP